LKRAERFGHMLGLILMDVDYFKQINDRYGHQMGDVVLQNISELISKHVRSVDSVYRWGGEEIVILCLEIDQAAIMDKAQMLRRMIEAHHCAALKEKITASFGVTLCHEGDTAAGVVQRADRAMYRAKNLGRNRVEML
jgi:polar amino acid transport system substrate-binding protein